MPTNTKVLIAEEHLLMAQGLRKLLETEFENVKITKCGRDLFSTVASFKPDVILLDSNLAQLHALEPTRDFQKLAEVSKVIMLASHPEPSHVVEAFRCGVSGYVLKQCSFPELIEAIDQVMSGRTYVTRLISPRAIAAAADRIQVKHAPPLTLRQREVLQLVAEGCTAKEIGFQLNLSVKTAVFHKMAIMDKLRLRTTAELTRYAIENKIVPAKWLQPARIKPAVESPTAMATAAPLLARA
jgi:DNA-binding NarL/FixJ family response regulator